MTKHLKREAPTAYVSVEVIQYWCVVCDGIVVCTRSSREEAEA